MMVSRKAPLHDAGDRSPGFRCPDRRRPYPGLEVGRSDYKHARCRPGSSRMTVIGRADSHTLEETLCHLGRVERLAELGQNGPLLASAGVDSLFHCLFGRDAIRMALDLL